MTLGAWKDLPTVLQKFLRAGKTLLPSLRVQKTVYCPYLLEKLAYCHFVLEKPTYCTCVVTNCDLSRCLPKVFVILLRFGCFQAQGTWTSLEDDFEPISLKTVSSFIRMRCNRVQFQSLEFQLLSKRDRFFDGTAYSKTAFNWFWRIFTTSSSKIWAWQDMSSFQIFGFDVSSSCKNCPQTVTFLPLL